MKKYQNELLQTVGIIMMMLSIAYILQPLIKTIFGEQLDFYFFDIVPHGIPAFVAWSVILIIGTLITIKVENNEKQPLKKNRNNIKVR